MVTHTIRLLTKLAVAFTTLIPLVAGAQSFPSYTTKVFQYTGTPKFTSCYDPQWGNSSVTWTASLAVTWYTFPNGERLVLKVSPVAYPVNTNFYQPSFSTFALNAQYVTVGSYGYTSLPKAPGHGTYPQLSSAFDFFPELITFSGPTKIHLQARASLTGGCYSGGDTQLDMDAWI
jgi:hypothetical protein